MHIAYSALTDPASAQQQTKNKKHLTNTTLLRYEAYQATCQKFSEEISQVQKYFPGWLPKFHHTIS